MTRDGPLRLSQPQVGTDLTIRDVRWSADPFKPAPYYGLRLSHFPDRESRWGVALDYTHYKVYARTAHQVAPSGTWKGAAVGGSATLNQYVQRFELSHGVNVLSASAIHRWRATGSDTRQVQPYLGLGLAYYRPHAETIVDSVPFETGYQSSGFGYQALAGAHYRFAEQSGLFVETKFNRGTARVNIAGGQAETPLRTVHLAVGISRSF